MLRTTHFKIRHRAVLGLSLVLVPTVCFIAFWVAWSNNNRPVKIHFPTPSVPSANGRDDFHQAYLLSKQMKHKSPYSMPVPPQQSHTDANFASCAADAVPVLAAIRAGLKKPCVEHPIRSVAGMMPFPANAELRELARIIAAVAEHYRRVGRYGDAAEAMLLGAEMAAAMCMGGTLITFMVARAVFTISLVRFEDIIPMLNPQELARIARRLEVIEARRVPFGEIVLEEGYVNASIMLATFKDPRANRLSLDYFNDWRWIVEKSENQPLTMRARFDILKFGMSDKGAMIRANLAYSAEVAREVDNRPYFRQSPIRRPDNPLMRLAGDTVFAVHRMHAAEKAEMALFRLQIALRRYRLSHGRHPASLSALVPTYLKSVPSDPFAGKHNVPPVYRPASDGSTYLLFSLGANMVDDGGKPLQYSRDLGPGDIVAGRINRSRKSIQ